LLPPQPTPITIHSEIHLLIDSSAFDALVLAPEQILITKGFAGPPVKPKSSGVGFSDVGVSEDGEGFDGFDQFEFDDPKNFTEEKERELAASLHRASDEIVALEIAIKKTKREKQQAYVLGGAADLPKLQSSLEAMEKKRREALELHKSIVEKLDDICERSDDPGIEAVRNRRPFKMEFKLMNTKLSSWGEENDISHLDLNSWLVGGKPYGHQGPAMYSSVYQSLGFAPDRAPRHEPPGLPMSLGVDSPRAELRLTPSQYALIFGMISGNFGEKPEHVPNPNGLEFVRMNHT